MNSQLPDGARVLLHLAHLIAMSAPFLAAAVAVGTLSWAMLARRRSVLVRGALSRRRRVEMVPTTSFDPAESDVVRWSHQLGRVHAAAGRVPARGAAARIHYRGEQGGMRCYVEGPERAAAVLNMPGFDQVEVRDARAGSGIQPVRFTHRPDAAWDTRR